MHLHLVKRPTKSGIAAIALALLSACGGGGSDTTSNPGTPDSLGVITTLGTGSTRAIGCLPSDMFTAGYTHTLDYTTTDTDPAVGSGTRREVQTLIGAATFNGATSQKFRLIDTTTDGSGTSTTDNYLHQALTGTRMIDYGASALDGTPLTVDNPGSVTDFGLYAGGNTRQTYTETSPQALSTPTSHSITETTTFVGLESVTVPAGTFATCHFRLQISDAPTGSIFDAWVSSTNPGVIVKVQYSVPPTGSSTAAVAHTEELTGGSVRGVAIVAP